MWDVMFILESNFWRGPEGVLNYPFKTLLFIKLLLFSSLSYHYGLMFILLFALIFIHSCIVYGKT